MGCLSVSAYTSNSVSSECFENRRRCDRSYSTGPLLPPPKHAHTQASRMNARRNGLGKFVVHTYSSCLT